MQQSPGTFSTIKCDIENTCVIHQKREIEIVMERGINTKSQREWGKCLNKAVSLVPRFACAPQDNSYRPPCQKVPCAERKHISFPRLSGSPWSKTNTEANFSISTKLYVFVNFWSLWNGIYSRTLYKRTHMYELRTTCNPQTVLIISSMRNIARSKHTRCNQMVFPSRVFVEICLPKWAREDAALVCSGLASVHFRIRGQGANGGREREAKSTRKSGTERDTVSRSVETFSGGGKPSAALQ